MKHWFTRNSVHFAIIGLFIAISFLYFTPAWQGKALVQQDVIQAKAMQREIMDFKAEDGTAPLWTNAMFGGMPSYQIWVSYPKNITTHIMGFFKTVFPNPIDTILFYLIGAYLLFNVMRVKPWIAALGAIAFAFSSYNFIYIEAGHASKAYAIAFFAPVIAGIFLTLRGKYLWGAALTALFLALEIRVNHIQMTYYLLIAMLILVGIELYHAVKEKKLVEFGKAIGSLAAACVLALAVNAGLLWTTYEYSQESIRGKSNLTTETKAAETKGVDRDYAYQWSQGVMENLTFLIPNAYGGGSGPQLDENSEVAKVLLQEGVPANQAVGFAQQMPTYWGDKPFTSGPWYFGAIVVFLFVLGIFIVHNRLKWWLLGATLLSLFLAFGRHLPFISDIFFNYFPLYNKFRAVESTLVIASLFIPILAVLALNEIITKRGEIPKLDKKVLYSFYIVGGLSLIVAILPSLFLSFKTSNHQAMALQLGQQLGDNNFAQSIMNALVKDRTSMARNDAFRSFIFVLIGSGVVWLWVKDKLKPKAAIILLAFAILIDMWAVNRRYLNKDNFVEESVLANQFPEREVDKFIKRDTQPDYRVLDLTISTFNSASTTYYHNTIGGYHAAKLMRYQELLERQFNNAINQDVLDMLNTKYVITSDGQDSQHIQNRNTAAGNAWFINRIKYVDSAEQEMQGLDSFDPKDVAIIHAEFKHLIDSARIGNSTNASIELVDYRPDHLVYEYSAPSTVVAVFSEIYYDKGWKAFVDGEEIPYFRADYLLRAAQLPGGNHKVEFKFEPQSYYVGETISLVASVLLILVLGFAIWREEKENTSSSTTAK
jgi:hypothetical protein